MSIELVLLLCQLQTVVTSVKDDLHFRFIIEHCLKCYGDRLDQDDALSMAGINFNSSLLIYDLLYSSYVATLDAFRFWFWSVLRAFWGEGLPILCWTTFETCWEGKLIVYILRLLWTCSPYACMHAVQLSWVHGIVAAICAGWHDNQPWTAEGTK